MNQDFTLNRTRKDPKVGIDTLYTLTGKRFVIDYNGYEQLHQTPEYFVTTIFLYFKKDSEKVELEWIDTRPVLYGLLDRYIPNVVSDYMKHHYPQYNPSDDTGKDWTCTVMVRKLFKNERKMLEEEGVEFSKTSLLEGEDQEIWAFNYGEPKTMEECDRWNTIPDLTWLSRGKLPLSKKHK